MTSNRLRLSVLTLLVLGVVSYLLWQNRPSADVLVGNTIVDRTFGIDGRVNVVEDHSPYIFNDPYLYGTALPNGQYLFTGFAGNFGRLQQENLLVRLNADGTRDGSFSGGLIVEKPLDGDDGEVSRLFGKPVALVDNAFLAFELVIPLTQSGYSYDYLQSQVRVVRYLPNGVRDTGFGTEGRGILLEDFPYNNPPQSLVIQPDGKILVGGKVAAEEGTAADGLPIRGYDFLVARYFPSGQIDTSFGNGGYWTARMTPGAVEEAAGLVLLPDGRILVHDSAWDDWRHSIPVVRLTNNGQLDVSFGVNGVLEIPAGRGELLAFSRLDDGSLAVVSAANRYVNDGNIGDIFINRYTEDGQNLTAFGAGGAVELDGPTLLEGKTGQYRSTDSGWLDAVIHPDGSVVLAAEGVQYEGDEWARAGQVFLRLTADGRPDDSFGTDGVAVYVFADPTRYNERDTFHKLMLGNDNTFLMLGRVWSYYGITLTRFHRETATPPVPQPEPVIVPVASVTAQGVVAEGDAGTGNTASFVVSLSEPTTVAVTVNVATEDGTASASSDYAPVQTTLTFAPGEIQKPVAVTLLGDTDVEADEMFRVVLSGPSGVTIGTGQASTTIVNDDVAPDPNPEPEPEPTPTVRLSSPDINVLEGDDGERAVTLNVELSAMYSSELVINYRTADGTAQAGSDYTAAVGTIAFAAGQTVRSVNVPIRGDTDIESDESFTVAFDAESSVVENTAEIMVTIDNDDEAPVVLEDPNDNPEPGDEATNTPPPVTPGNPAPGRELVLVPGASDESPVSPLALPADTPAGTDNSQSDQVSETSTASETSSAEGAENTVATTNADTSGDTSSAAITDQPNSLAQTGEFAVNAEVLQAVTLNGQEYVAADVEKPSLSSDGTLALTGKTAPNETVTLYVYSEPKTYTTTANSDGIWTFNVPVSELEPGDHRVEVETPSQEKALAIAFTVKAADESTDEKVDTTTPVSIVPTTEGTGTTDTGALIRLITGVLGILAFLYVLWWFVNRRRPADGAGLNVPPSSNTTGT